MCWGSDRGEACTGFRFEELAALPLAGSLQPEYPYICPHLVARHIMLLDSAATFALFAPLAGWVQPPPGILYGPINKCCVFIRFAPQRPAMDDPIDWSRRPCFAWTLEQMRCVFCYILPIGSAPHSTASGAHRSAGLQRSHCSIHSELLSWQELQACLPLMFENATTSLVRKLVGLVFLRHAVKVAAIMKQNQQFQ
jgi:hypothetical protein